MIGLEFKSDEANERLRLIREMVADTLVGTTLSERSRMILGFHPEWTELDRGDYNVIVVALRRVFESAASGNQVTRDDLAEATWAVYQPRLAAKVGFNERNRTNEHLRWDILDAVATWTDG